MLEHQKIQKIQQILVEDGTIKHYVHDCQEDVDKRC